MRQQEDFRTPGRGAADATAAPFFDDQSAAKAAPVVPLDKVARRERFARWAGGWRETVRTPQFRRSWPLALLLVATLAAAVAATNVYNDDARSAAPTNGAATAETAAGATADAEIATTPPARDETDNSRAARDARRGRDGDPSTDAAPAGSSQAFAASALGSFPGGEGDRGDARDEQGDAAASGRDERGGERDKGKRQKRSKRRHGARRSGGGAILFDVIR